MDKCKIIIGGDLAPTEANNKYFEDGNVNLLLKNLVKNFNSSDLNVINLECPLLIDKSPVDKIGPNLGANIKCVKFLKNANINVVNLGNNHSMDHGINGIKSTIKILQENNIDILGIGKNIDAANKIYVKKINNIRIGIISIAETGFYTANRNKFGTCNINVIDIYNEIKNRKKEFDYMIALIHGGIENYPYPSPQGQKLSRFLINIGVDCIIWQHSHCPGYIEKYNEKFIVYGQGNFIFDMGKMNPDWYKGYLVELNLKRDKKSRIETAFNIIPYIQSFEENGIYMLEGNMKKQFINDIFSEKHNLSKDTYVEKKWNEFCNNNKNWYISELLGYKKSLKKMDVKNNNRLNKEDFDNLNIDKDIILKLRNLMLNESYYEMIKSSIELYINQDKNIKK